MLDVTEGFPPGKKMQREDCLQNWLLTLSMPCIPFCVRQKRAALRGVASLSDPLGYASVIPPPLDDPAG